MDAVKFLQERNRMFMSGAATPSIGLEDDYDPVIAVKVVEKWSAEHPRKTRQSVFLEQYPEAILDVFKILRFCPADISATHRRGDGECKNPKKACADCRREFWMQEVK
jgi:hypothetical protein